MLDSLVHIWKEGIQGSEIHRHMMSVCRNEAPSWCIVYCYLANFSSRVETAAKGVRTGHTVANEAAVSGLIMVNRYITFNKMKDETGFARGTLQAIVHNHLNNTLAALDLAVLPHASYSPHLTPTDYTLLDKMKDAVNTFNLLQNCMQLSVGHASTPSKNSLPKPSRTS